VPLVTQKATIAVQVIMVVRLKKFIKDDLRMETLWNENNEYIGTKLTKEESNLIQKVLGKLSRNDLDKMGLSTEEKEKFSQLVYDLY